MTGLVCAVTVVVAHLSQHIERLHHISLYLELKLDELLGQPLLCLPTQFQHLPVRAQPITTSTRPRTNQSHADRIEMRTRAMRTENNSMAESIIKDKCMCVCVSRAHTNLFA